MTDTKQKLPRFIKLVIWPDDYTTSTLVLHTEAPKYVARMERIKNNTELRVSVLKYQQDYMQCQKTNPAGLINEILLWDFQMHGEPSARIHLNTMENPGAIYVPTLMFAYEPPSHENQAIISVIQIHTDSRIEEYDHNTPNQIIRGMFELFTNRLSEILQEGTPGHKPAPKTDLPKFFIKYESASDYECLRDKQKQPGNYYKWEEHIAETINRAKAARQQLPPAKTLDGAKYLLWLAKTKNTISLETQIQFLETQD